MFTTPAASDYLHGEVAECSSSGATLGETRWFELPQFTSCRLSAREGDEVDRDVVGEVVGNPLPPLRAILKTILLPLDRLEEARAEGHDSEPDRPRT